MASSQVAMAPVSAPELRFTVQGSSALAHAAVPTLAFALRIDAPAGQTIRSVLLDVQIQIAARRRGYSTEAQERLLEIFGAPERWGTTLHTLPWLRTSLIVPGFETTTCAELRVACTYDLEVIAARYLSALADGTIPLELLLSGSVFFDGRDGRLQTARIPWDQEVEHQLPVAVWRAAMDRHFPDSAWLRLGSEPFARLSAYKARHAFVSWDEAITAMLAAAEAQP